MKKKIHYAKPSITEKELAYAADAAENGWGEHCYEYIERFQSQFCSYLGSRYAVATSSCTGAFHLGLAALGIGDGDEVIIADINWTATASSVIHLGATPIFVDVRPDSWCIDVEKVKAAITPKTKAIVAVHLYGNLCELDKLLNLGEEFGIPVIEDAAEAIGSIWNGKLAGSMGRFGVFSFHGTKTLTTGEGGMFVTNDLGLFEKVLMLNNHGRSRSETRQFWSEAAGFKYRMSNIQAAIGCAQLERIDELITRKREIFACYHEKLSDLPLQMNPEPEGTVNSYWMPTVVVDEHLQFDREQLLTSFKKEDIDGRVFFWPLSMMPPYFQSEAALANPVSYGLYRRAFNLPSYHDINEDDIDRVCQVVRTHLLTDYRA